MKKIIKSRENPKILEIQNPLQKGFTEDTTPLLCELLIEEFDNNTRAKISSVEWKLVDRQLLLKNGNSHSWFMDIKKICLKYDIQQCHQYLGTDHLTSRGGLWFFFSKKYILIPNVAEKNLKYSDFSGGKKNSDSEFLSYNLMLNSGKTLRDKKNKYPNSRVVRKKILNEAKNPICDILC